jgi:hypothetical protein
VLIGRALHGHLVFDRMHVSLPFPSASLSFHLSLLSFSCRGILSAVGLFLSSLPAHASLFVKPLHYLLHMGILSAQHLHLHADLSSGWCMSVVALLACCFALPVAPHRSKVSPDIRFTKHQTCACSSMNAVRRWGTQNTPGTTTEHHA